MPKLFIQSCHAALELDHATTFLSLGYEVFGDFDIGSKQRAKILGVTDKNSLWQDFDLLILHQVPEYCRRMKELLEAGKRVVLVDFGQTDEWQYKEAAELCIRHPHAYVAAYSKKDYRRHIHYGCPSHKVRLIRFGKDLTSFLPWIGDGGYLYASCNSIQHRGEGCGWVHMERAMKELPIKLSGKETEQVGGLGEITEEEMHLNYQNAAGFISFGTTPAPLVLTQIEAWCAGCPTVIYDNRHGVIEEDLAGILEQDVGRMIEQGKKLLEDKEYRQYRHLDSLENARQFDGVKVAEEWASFLEIVTKN